MQEALLFEMSSMMQLDGDKMSSAEETRGNKSKTPDQILHSAGQQTSFITLNSPGHHMTPVRNTHKQKYFKM